MGRGISVCWIVSPNEGVKTAFRDGRVEDWKVLAMLEKPSFAEKTRFLLQNFNAKAQRGRDTERKSWREHAIAVGNNDRYSLLEAIQEAVQP